MKKLSKKFNFEENSLEAYGCANNCGCECSCFWIFYPQVNSYNSNIGSTTAYVQAQLGG